MKKFLFTMVALLSMAVSSQAMSYEQARQQALFLADKMAYELNLNEEQYEACYEINLDYFMGITSYDDLYGDYWTRRNLDLSYILLDWQYRMFLDASYFYRPLYWNSGRWHFGIYARYPHRDYFYFGRPHFYNVYRGGHAWHMHEGRSWYNGRDFGHRGGTRNHFSGMRDGYNNGHYGRGSRMRYNDNRNRGYDNGIRGRQSSTRSTAGYRDYMNRGVEQQSGYSSFGGSRFDRRDDRQDGSIVTQRSIGMDREVNRGADVTRRSSTFGGNRSSSFQRPNVDRSIDTQSMGRQGATMMQRESRSTMSRSSSPSMNRSMGGSSMSRSIGGSSMGRSSGSSMGGHSNGRSGGSFGGSRR